MNIVSNFDLNTYSGDELASYLRSASKIANTRLREIEKQGLTRSSDAYRAVEAKQFEYNELFGVTSKGEMKFRTNFKNMSRNELLHQASAVNDFLSRKTSTIKGTKEKYPKGYETFKEHFEDQFETKAPSQDEMNELWSNKMLQKFKDIYGSEEIVRMMNATNQNPQRFLEMMKKYSKDISYLSRLKDPKSSKYYDINNQLWNDIQSGF
ncbi:MAG: hypothetical protein MJZ03_03845 [archaeon]|nr:hypothetical protein [archaeon]